MGGFVISASTATVHTTENSSTRLEMPTPIQSQLRPPVSGATSKRVPGAATMPGRRQIAPTSRSAMMTTTPSDISVTPQVSGAVASAFAP